MNRIELVFLHVTYMNWFFQHTSAEMDTVAAWGIAYDFLDKTKGRLVCKIDS